MRSIACKCIPMHTRCHTHSNAFKCTQMPSSACKCIQMRANAAKRIQMNANAIKCVQVRSNAFECIAFQCVQMCWKHTNSFKCAQMNQMHANARKCTQMHANARKCMHMRSNAFKCTQMHSNAFKCIESTPIPSNARKCIQTHANAFKCVHLTPSRISPCLRVISPFLEGVAHPSITQFHWLSMPLHPPLLAKKNPFFEIPSRLNSLKCDLDLFVENRCFFADWCS